MRASIFSLVLLLASASPALAAEGGSKVDLLTPHGGLMLWTLLIFIGLFFILSRYAFGPITKAVEQREQALQDAIDQAKKDREEAARILAEHRAQLEGSRAEAQKIIAEGRAVGEKLRADMLEETRAQQQDLLERARREIAGERDLAIAQIREEAVDLAIAAAGKVIEKNLDDSANRKLVEGYIASAKVRAN
ncbi:MAG: F0F1 ATP synthase subunit B [Gemmatimonadaceae bacterium]